MKIILMEDVPALGRRGEIREVANGYARNFLLPKKMAIPATAGNVQNLEHLKRQHERAEQQVRDTARAAADRIGGLTLAVATRASDDGRLFGSVSAQDVAAFLERNQIAVERRRIQLEEPIKALGEYEVPIRLHHDVTATLKVTVTRE
jgi:large subunit ribosomal protein L9